MGLQLGQGLGTAPLVCFEPLTRTRKFGATKLAIRARPFVAPFRVALLHAHARLQRIPLLEHLGVDRDAQGIVARLVAAVQRRQTPPRTMQCTVQVTGAFRQSLEAHRQAPHVMQRLFSTSRFEAGESIEALALCDAALRRPDLRIVLGSRRDRLPPGVVVGLSLHIALRYSRSKKRRMISVITLVATTGVALGVGALLAVVAITSGFQEQFREKVLGVNAHVLVLKYGLDFREYRRVEATVRRMPEVSAVSSFTIHEMMIAHDKQISSVLVKGIDPKQSPRVLDLPKQLIEGDLRQLRRPGATPATASQDALGHPGSDLDLKNYLDSVDSTVDDVGSVADAAVDGVGSDDSAPRPPATTAQTQSPPKRENSSKKALVAPDPAVVARRLADLEARPDGLELPSWDSEDTWLDQQSDVGFAPTNEPLPGLVLGVELANNLDLQVGDQVRLVSPLAGLDASLWSPQGQAPRSRDFRVSAIFFAGFQEYDSRLVYVDLYEAQRFFDHGDVVTGVEMRLHDHQKARRVARRLEAKLGDGPYHTMDWAELNHNLFTALEVQKLMLGLVIATIIFVAAFNVVATLMMMVLDKRRDIAILQAMGARRASILLIFATQGLLIGLVGTALGLAIGGGVCFLLMRYPFPLDARIYLIDHLPVQLSWAEVGMTTLTAMAICGVATLVPSWWAARMRPSEGVRFG